MEHPAGFEPATSRLPTEVTAIFTTDRGKQFGGERAMLLLPVRADDLSVCGPRTRSALSRRVTDSNRRPSPLRSNSRLHHRPSLRSSGGGPPNLGSSPGVGGLRAA